MGVIPGGTIAGDFEVDDALALSSEVDKAGEALGADPVGVATSPPPPDLEGDAGLTPHVPRAAELQLLGRRLRFLGNISIVGLVRTPTDGEREVGVSVNDKPLVYRALNSEHSLPN